MSRLTEKNEFGYILHIKPVDNSIGNEIAIVGETANKLGQLEDIEDDFGIEFSMLDKICKNGVYCYKKSIKDFIPLGKRLGDIIHIQNSDIHIQFFGVYKQKRMGVSIMGCIDYVYHSLPIKDYGKTWALTKEELL